MSKPKKVKRVGDDGLTRSQRRAKRKEQEKLTRERDANQNDSAGIPPSPVTAAESKPQPITATSEINATTESANQSSDGPPSTRAERIIARCTLALVCVAIVQAICMGIQSWISAKQIEQTQQTLSVMRQQSQAWLEIGSPYIVELEIGKRPEMVPPGKIWSVRIPIANHGQTPGEVIFKTTQIVPYAGFDYEKAFSNEILNPESEMNRKRRDAIDYSMVVGQNESTEIGNTYMADDLTSNFYVLTQIVYRDAFAKEHPARGCYLYSAKAKKFFPVPREVERQKSYKPTEAK